MAATTTTNITYRNVPANRGGTYINDPTPRAAAATVMRLGAVDLIHSVGVYFSIGTTRCFLARISARVHNLDNGSSEPTTADAIMARKIRVEVAARLDEEAARSRWPAANAHMRETAVFVCSAAAERDWESSPLCAVVQGVQDWLGWKSKLKGAVLRFGGIARPSTIVRDGFVVNRQMFGNATIEQLEVPEGMTGVDDVGSGQFWEVVVVRSVPSGPGERLSGSGTLSGTPPKE